MAADSDHARRWQSPCGWFEANRHVLPLRVYYEDTDAAGIVYYANYLRFAERGRTEMMRCLGAEHPQSMQQAGIAFVVRQCAAEYLQPARIDDAIAVVSGIEKVGGASLSMVQRVVRCDDDAAPTELVRLKVRLACLDKALRPARMPQHLRAAFVALTDN